MQLRFDPVSISSASLASEGSVGDAARLVEFFVGSTWPYHHESHVGADWVRARADSGYFSGPEVRSFWIGDSSEDPLGFVRVFDLSDVTPLFDLRIAEAARGRGVGTLALRGLTTWFFSEFPSAGRLAGYTRYDNSTMRRVFEKCGYLQEALHRRAWRREGAEPVDAVGYAILRDEAEAL